MKTASSLERTKPDILALLEPADLERFISLIQDKLGIPFPKDRWGDLARHLRDLTVSSGFENPGDFVTWFLSNENHKNHVELLAKQLTIGETYFFRDEKIFQWLRNNILPQLRCSQKKKIILWSAGCSSGEEPYSIAITTHMTAFSNTKDVQIIASDINPNALNKARLGVYSNWSFRNPPLDIVKKYFTKIDRNQFQIATHIQEKVLFAQINLVSKTYPPPLDKPASVDVIFCRNVLMYFTPEKRKNIMNRFCLLLVDGGWFVVSASEAAFIQHPSLILDRSTAPNIFRKGSIEKQNAPIVRKITNTHPVPSVPTKKTKRPPRISDKGKGTPIPGVKSSLSETQTEETLLKKARRLCDDKRLAEAASLLKDHLDRQETLGSDALSQKQHEIIAFFAQIQADLGDLDQAEQWYRRAIALDRLKTDYYYLLAMILLEKKRPEESITLLEKVLFLQPDFIIAHFHLASLYQDKKRAQKFARNVLELLSPTNPDATIPFSDGLTEKSIRNMAQQMIGS